MATVNTGFLKLAKCAYIFDWSHSVYSYGTREQIKHKYAVEKELKTYYEDTEKRAEPLPYTKDENNNIFVEICGEAHALNDIQISEIDEADNIINHRRVINTADIIEQLPSFHPFCSDSLHNNLFRSFYIEFFTVPDDLGYIRVHFNNNIVKFVIDDRNGDIYTSGEHGRCTKTSRNDLMKHLHINSEKARTEFKKLWRL